MLGERGEKSAKCPADKLRRIQGLGPCLAGEKKGGAEAAAALPVVLFSFRSWPKTKIKTLMSRQMKNFCRAVVGGVARAAGPSKTQKAKTRNPRLLPHCPATKHPGIPSLHSPASNFCVDVVFSQRVQTELELELRHMGNQSRILPLLLRSCHENC